MDKAKIVVVGTCERLPDRRYLVTGWTFDGSGLGVAGMTVRGGAIELCGGYTAEELYEIAHRRPPCFVL